MSWEHKGTTIRLEQAMSYLIIVIRVSLMGFATRETVRKREDWGMIEGGQGLVRLGRAEVRTGGEDAVVRRQWSGIMGYICAV